MLHSDPKQSLKYPDTAKGEGHPPLLEVKGRLDAHGPAALFPDGTKFHVVDASFGLSGGGVEYKILAAVELPKSPAEALAEAEAAKSGESK